jgi:hypothetical protein
MSCDRRNGGAPNEAYPLKGLCSKGRPGTAALRQKSARVFRQGASVRRAVMETSLLVSQRNQRIDLRRTTRRDVASQQSHNRQ